MRLLDLFSGAGGAAEGYRRAGFDEIVGVDVVPQPRYPFEFVRGDAFDYLDRYGRDFDVIHASPPCKVHTSLKAFSSKHHVDLVPATRAGLLRAGRPWVIENVVGAPLLDPVRLCGSSFDLGVQRHRLFESSEDLVGLPCEHARQAAASPGYLVARYHGGKKRLVPSPVIGVYGRGQGLGPGEVEQWKRAMGIDWMIRDELREAIPPAYTEYLGRQLLGL